jgi:hypothetical protein
LCFDGEKDIVADRDFLIMMPKNSSFTKLVGEEACFMGEVK